MPKKNRDTSWSFSAVVIVLAFGELIYGAFANDLIAGLGLLTLSVFAVTLPILERLNSIINHVSAIDLITRDREETAILSEIKSILSEIKSKQEEVAP